MNRSLVWLGASLCLLAYVPVLSAQRGSQGGSQQGAANQSPGQQSAGQQGASQQGAGGSGATQFPGLTWPRDAWDKLNAPEVQETKAYRKDLKDRPFFTFCYELSVTTGSLSTPPFVLKPVDHFDDYWDPNALPCLKPPDDRHPIMMRGRLVIAIDARRVPTNRMRSLNLNVTTQQGSPLYPNPVRPSPGGTTAGGAPPGGAPGGAVREGLLPPVSWGRVYYLMWPQELQGDVIPTFTVNLVYTPAVPGTPWQQNTVYPEGSVVTPTSNNGHYYTARVGGISSTYAEPNFAMLGFQDNQVLWIDSGTTSPAGLPGSATTTAASGAPAAGTAQNPIANWKPSTHYPAGAIIYYPPIGRYYLAQTDGTSDSSKVPDFSVKTFQDGTTLVWVDSGTTPPSGTTQSPASLAWIPDHPYKPGEVIFDQRTSRYYTASVGGTSADASRAPHFILGTFNDHDPLVWTDIGPTLPPTPQLQLPTWTANNVYKAGDVIFNPVNAHYYTATQGGTSGPLPSSPFPTKGLNSCGTANWSRISNGQVVWSEFKVPEWAPDTPYKAGFVVYDPDDHSKFYQSLQDITSGKTPNWKHMTNGNMDWSSRVAEWVPGTPYESGQIVSDPGDPSKYYRAMDNGTSGPVPSQPAFPANQQCLVTEYGPTIEPYLAPESVNVVVDDQAKRTETMPANWIDVGRESDENASKACPKPKESKGTEEAAQDWIEKHRYDNGSCILDPNTKHYFKLKLGGYQQGVSGGNRPAFQATAQLPKNLSSIQWDDSGTTPPSLVTAGQPADQVVSLTYTLPQVHAKYYYNISSAVVFSTVLNRSFGWETLKLPTGSGANATLGSYYPIQTGSSPSVDPVLFFTAYPWPMDAESTWRRKDLYPGIVFGLSLTSPASSFYVGGSIEVRRNIQIVLGYNVAQTARLAPGSGLSTSNSTAPQTVQKFSSGAFIGLSYNISGFLQGLFGGGKGSQ